MESQWFELGSRRILEVRWQPSDHEILFASIKLLDIGTRKQAQ